MYFPSDVLLELLTELLEVLMYKNHQETQVWKENKSSDQPHFSVHDNTRQIQ